MTKWCATVGCRYSSKKLNELLKQPCFIHKGRLRRDCPCDRPYTFFQLPSDINQQQAWKAALQLKDPPKAENFHVCSFHFVEKKPTKTHPNPELYLGYEKKQKTRRVLKKDARSSEQAQIKTKQNNNQHKTAESSQPIQKIQEVNEANKDSVLKVGTKGELFPQPTAIATRGMGANTQWVDISLIDHQYASVRNCLFSKNVSTQTEAGTCCSILYRALTDSDILDDTLGVTWATRKPYPASVV